MANTLVILTFFIVRREDKQAYLNCMVIHEDCVVSQHKLVMTAFRF